MDYELTLSLGEAPVLAPPAEDARAKQLVAIAKQVTRKAAKAADEGAAVVWPRRVLRWKR